MTTINDSSSRNIIFDEIILMTKSITNILLFVFEIECWTLFWKSDTYYTGGGGKLLLAEKYFFFFFF